MIIMSFRFEPFMLPEDFCPSEFDAICGWARQNFGHGTWLLAVMDVLVILAWIFGDESLTNPLFFMFQAGNRRLRDIIAQNVPLYKKAKTKTDKGKIIVDLCEQLIISSPSKTGFVKLDPKGGQWFFIGYEKSKDKVGHALRKATARSRSKSMKSKLEQQPQVVVHSSSDSSQGEEIQRAVSSLPTGDDSMENNPDDLPVSRRSAGVELPSAASLPKRKTQHSTEKAPSHALHYVFGGSPAEPKKSYPEQLLQLEGSPVRRSMFDSPLKTHSRYAMGAANEAVTIPLPMSTTTTSAELQETAIADMGPTEQPETVEQTRHPSQPQAPSFPPPHYPHYYYPPPTGYVYYPVHMHYAQPYAPLPYYYPPPISSRMGSPRATIGATAPSNASTDGRTNDQEQTRY
jgi:hypothetical protein